MEIVNSWDEILADSDAEYKDVPISETKSIRIGTLSAAEMLAWQESQSDPAQKKINGLLLVTRSIVNTKGERIGNLAEVEKLRTKQPKTLKALMKAAIELNGLKATVEEKNDSSAASNVAARTDSPAISVE